MKYLLFILIIMSGLMAFSQKKYEVEWKQVDSLFNLGQAQTALKTVEPIYAETRLDGNTSQFLKASLYRLSLMSKFEEDMLVKAILSLQEELKEPQPAVSNIQHSMLAELYWRYYQNNRYRFYERTATSDFDPADMLTWDLKRIVQQCIRHYTLSLENESLIQSISLSDYEPILVSYPESRSLRPTLFDFLAYRAVDFYMNSEAGLTQPADKFLVDQDNYFSEAVLFNKLTITSADTLSFDLKAIQILQSLLKFHQEDTNPEAFVEADLKRLSFVHQHCILPEKDSLYLSALKVLENTNRLNPCSAEVIFYMAQLMVTRGGSYDPLKSEKNRWDLRDALKLTEDAILRFPESLGAHNCKVLQEQIRRNSHEITCEYAALPDKPALALLSYKNTREIFFRLIKADPSTESEINENGTAGLIAAYLQKKADLEWTQKLPDDGDYQLHRSELRLPALKPGYYVLLASANAEFTNDNQVSLNRFWRTRISYIDRRNENGSYELFVLDSQEGKPVPKVKVQSFFKEYDYKTRSYKSNPGNVFYSDQEGYLNIPSIKKDNYNQYYLEFTLDGDKFITESYFSGYYYQQDDSRKQVLSHFFTDRAIYRPGQTLYFKGIVTERSKLDVKLKPNYKTTLTFYDVNYQKVSSLDLVSNEYGSFSGSFTIPSSVLTGNMTLQNESGAMVVQVEEYKRPKFEVSFTPVKGSYKLGEMVKVTGKAQAYAGSNITDAAVSYRVVRTARFPYVWWGWREWMPESPEIEISNGVSTTDDKGEFDINFKAIADASLEAKYSPVFSYRVLATVTDLNGETHESETTVSVGYQALLLNLSLPEQLNLGKQTSFVLTSTNLNGEKENSKGSINIWKLKDPQRVFKSRSWSRPDQFIMSRAEFEKEFPNDVYDQEDQYESWEKEKLVYTYSYDSQNDSLLELKGMPGWKPGRYFYAIESKDAFGTIVTKTGYFLAYDPKSLMVPAGEVSWFVIPETRLEPGSNALVLMGSSAKDVTAIYEVMQNEKVLSRKVLKINQQQLIQTIPVLEEHRGNITVNMAFVKMNRSWQSTKTIEVPWTNRKLDIRFASFRSKLKPGEDEEWLISIRDHKGEKAWAEMLAGMYDASLDAFVPNVWNFNILNYFNMHYSWDVNSAFGNRGSIQNWYPGSGASLKSRTYDRLNWFGFEDYGGYQIRRAEGLKMADMAVADESPLMSKEKLPAREENESIFINVEAKGVPPPVSGVTEPQVTQPAKVRSDFKETAFFYPHLTTDENGDLQIRFKMPESLTKWKMMGLAVSKDLKVGQVEKSLVTQKELMVFPNAPRFFREGDKMEFSCKISNLSDTRIQGSSVLQLFDAFTMKPVGEGVLTDTATKEFSIDKGGNTVISWKLSIPEDLQAIVYRVTASSGIFSDGEEAVIPVLTNRMLVTESLPLPVNGNQTRKFNFEKLIRSGKESSTLRNYRLTLEYTSNPAWYAVQALPYLMEYPYECAEQVFSRYYANSLASHIANSDPKIKAVFESWKSISPDALKSNLEKNQELKSILLEESPWVQEASNESERKQRIAILFDLNRMNNELGSALKKLNEMQAPNGGWPWFKGMPDNRYITQHIVTGLGHLDHLGVTEFRQDSKSLAMLQSAIRYLDARIKEDFDKIVKEDKDYLKNDHLGYEVVQYLYARSYFMVDIPLEKQEMEAFNYFKSQAGTYWKTRNNYLKGMLALALHRFSETKTAGLIMRSISETALHNEEMGMYWRNETRGWFWYQAPIETQALLIEAYDEVLNDQESVEELKIWLLKQKQTQDWKTTKATSEAVYALLLRGSDLLSSDKLVSIQLGSEKVDPGKLEGNAQPEAGTGYFKTSWSRSEIRPEMGKVTITNPNPTVAWGSLYWQYFEQLDKITPAQTPLSLSKKLFREVNTATGPVIVPVDEQHALKVGDKIVVRVELRTDRDMEYVHLKDMRASAFEPLNVLSGYRWQDGLGYYESTRDASSNFFISYLPKGTYVFEYRLFATQKGDFSNGITSVQCMYAPEFSAHSEGIRVKVE
ncbi:MAG: hypothetical protein IPH84_11110 [Bacteroidales bacterium]|nr:hypothetical protein [Bacteroidales bacterium]